MEVLATKVTTRREYKNWGVVCKYGHERSEDNTYIWREHRTCRVCAAERKRRAYQLKHPNARKNYGNPGHGSLTKYSNHGCRCEDCLGAYRNVTLKKLYGITLQIYNELLEEQDGLCAICRIPQEQSNSRFHVDHDHINKTIRGILCHNCNVALGHVKEDEKIIKAMLTYLKGEY